MFCPNCGKETEKEALFCQDCGANLSNQAGYNVTDAVSGEEKKITSGYAIAGFVLGIISWFLNLMGLIGLLAVIFSAMAMSQIKRDNKKGKTFAWIGLISGIINICYAVLVLFFIMGRV